MGFKYVLLFGDYGFFALFDAYGFLKDDHLQLYKRENSNLWQIKLKLPKQKAIRKSSGSKIIEEAKAIALEMYSKISKNKQLFKINKNYNYKKIHLIESRKLSKKEIECFLNESE